MTVREVAVLAMLDDEAECGGVPSRGFGVGDGEGVKGVRLCMRPFALGRTVCGVAVCVDEEDAEESDGEGDAERDEVVEEEEEPAGSAVCIRDAVTASVRSCCKDAMNCYEPASSADILGNLG